MASTFTLTTLEDTRAVARQLAPTLKRGDVLALSGDLGAGKTTFARYLIEALGGGSDATSPTFTLLQTYPIMLNDRPATLYHYDLYRIQTPQELVELGMEEALLGLTLIEWPERLADASIITIALKFNTNNAGARDAVLYRIKA